MTVFITDLSSFPLFHCDSPWRIRNSLFLKVGALSTGCRSRVTAGRRGRRGGRRGRGRRVGRGGRGRRVEWSEESGVREERGVRRVE
jgi:hypothetical protein